MLSNKTQDQNALLYHGEFHCVVVKDWLLEDKDKDFLSWGIPLCCCQGLTSRGQGLGVRGRRRGQGLEVWGRGQGQGPGLAVQGRGQGLKISNVEAPVK